jgi:IS1 family transposase
MLANAKPLKHNVHIGDVNMNKLPIAKRAQILGLLVEGNSLRAASRLADCSINTVTKLLVDVGIACEKYHDEHVRDVPSKRIQCDEIWSFVYAKDKNAPLEAKAAGKAGDVWTWTAIDADTKLIVSWQIGRRDSETGMYFMRDLASRVSERIQLTTDAFASYRALVGDAFHGDVDYAMLVKIFSGTIGAGRYSPGECCGTTKKVIRGNPDTDHISTSYVERQNLTMRMGMRRFTRLTNGFSKKVENHAHAVALHFMYYNFGRIHKTLRITPAMASGVSDHVWSLEEIAALA